MCEGDEYLDYPTKTLEWMAKPSNTLGAFCMLDVMVDVTVWTAV